ncbi:MAG: TonB-dependent receptor, partial [Vicinamibacterales bacterium]
RTNTFNGDINEDSLDQSIYQPSAAEQAALAAAGYTGFPTSGATAANTPFPFWRCLGNVLLRDEPGEKCNGLINRTATSQYNLGGSAQLSMLRTAERRHQLTVGVAYDRGHVGFDQSSELGYLTPDRGVTGTGAFGDGVTGGDVDGEPFDTRVDLTGVQQTVSLYATDTLALGDSVHVSLSGRLNRTTVNNEDGINPGGGPGSLDGDHVFTRFNPAAGLTWAASRAVTAYAGYSEGSRAATSIELGCADPESPCKLPNAMAGDPPLDQVVTRTVEAGVRGRGRTNWNAGFFFGNNDNDILFVTSEQTGFGYFRNFGQTRRQGIELGADTRLGRTRVGASYTFLDATFQSEETVNGEANSSNEDAEEGFKGLEGEIEIEPGDRMPIIPQHMFKAFADLAITGRIGVNVNLVGASSVFARGNENNDHEEDAPYYLGPGSAAGYAIVNLGVRFDATSRLQIIGQLNNLFDRRYYTAAQLGPLGFTGTGAFIARPFPAVDGEFPVQNSTFFAPGAPIRGWVGFRLRL